MLTASALVPLWNRADEWSRRLAMIRDAHAFLYLSTYYIEYDAYGIEMLDALGEAQRRGVAINLLIDGFGQQLGGVLMPAEAKAALAARLDALTILQLSAQQRGQRIRRRIAGAKIAPGILVDFTTEETAAISAFFTQNLRSLNETRVIDY